MKKLMALIIMLVLHFSAFAQEEGTFLKFREFNVGMNEQEFLKLIEGKYTYKKITFHTLLKETQKPPLGEYETFVISYNLENFFVRIGDVGFNMARFFFVENRLYKIFIGIESHLSDKEVTRVSDYLHKNYSKCQFKTSKFPNSKATKDTDKYYGARCFKNNVSSKDSKEEGQQIKFGYHIKKSCKDNTYITFEDFTIKNPWKAIVKMRQEAIIKDVKPFERFRKAYLGMHFTKFRETFPNIEQIENPIKDEELIIYKNCQAYLNKDEKLDLIGIPLNDIVYFFYEDLLIAIFLYIPDDKVNDQQYKKFLEDMQKVYGNYTKETNTAYKWIAYDENLNIQMVLFRKNKGLIYANEYLGSIMFEKAKEIEKKELKSDF